MISTLSLAEMNYEVGVGANYGGIIGVTANKKIESNVEVFGGIGLVGAVAGARYYLNDNIRLNTNYGVHGLIVAKESSDDKIKLLHGINIGVDYIWGNGISLGLVYPVTSNADDAVDELRKKGYDVEKRSIDVLLSLGYRF